MNHSLIEKCYAELLPVFEELDASAVRPVKGDVPTIVALVLEAYPRLLDLEQSIRDSLPTDVEPIRRLDAYAMALSHADALCKSAPRDFKLKDVRDRAYTATGEIYSEARHAVIYLRWNYADADTIAPPLFWGRSGEPIAKTGSYAGWLDPPAIVNPRPRKLTFH